MRIHPNLVFVRRTGNIDRPGLLTFVEIEHGLYYGAPAYRLERIFLSLRLCDQSKTLNRGLFENAENGSCVSIHPDFKFIRCTRDVHRPSLLAGVGVENSLNYRAAADRRQSFLFSLQFCDEPCRKSLRSQYQQEGESECAYAFHCFSLSKNL